MVWFLYLRAYQPFYGHLPPITKTIQVRWTWHAGHHWRSKDELISDVLLWTPLHGRAKVGRPARTYIQRLCAIQDVAWKSSRERWTIETDCERGSGRHVLAVLYDDDDDDDINPWRLFNAKAILLEELRWCYLTHSWEDKGVHTFPKGICPKVNVIAWLEFKLAYYDSAVHRSNYYSTRTPPRS